MEVAVLAIRTSLAARLHRTEGSHAAVGLELLAAHEHDIAGGFLAASQKRAEHHGAGAGHDRLSDVAGVLDAAVADHRNTRRGARPIRLIDRCDLRDSHTCHHAGGADGPRTHAHLYAVGTGIDECLRTFERGDVATHDVDTRFLLQPAHHVEHRTRMSVRSVDNQEINASLNECTRALLGVLPHTNRGTDNQPAVGVFGCMRVLVRLNEILDREKTFEFVVRIDERQLLNLVLSKKSECVVGIDTHWCGDQWHARHDFMHRTRHVLFETHIAVSHDPLQNARLIDNRHAGNSVAAAHRIDVGQGIIRAAGDRVTDHACFGSFDQIDLPCLLVERQVAMEHSHSALACHGNGHAGLGDGVHRTGHQRHLDRNVPGDEAGSDDVAGNDVGFPWK